MAEVQCRQIVRAGHRCPRAAKRDEFCNAHWLMRYGHQYDTPNLICARCNEAWQPGRKVYDFKRRVTYRIEVGGLQVGRGYSLGIAMAQARKSLNND